jgi:large subunit ribosomal protein L25
MAAKRERLKLDFKVREKKGKGANRKLRAKKMIPAVLYGPEFKEGLVGSVDLKPIAPVANGPFRETTIIELALSDGSTQMALIRDLQRHPLTLQLLHLDFYQVIKGHKIKVEIPIRVINREISPGIKEGGLLDQPLRNVMMEVAPSDIPEEIIVDAKDMEIGSEFLVSDLELPEDAEWMTDPETIVAQVIVSHIDIEEEEPEEGEEEGEVEGEEESAEVEVIAKGKDKDKEEEE